MPEQTKKRLVRYIGIDFGTSTSVLAYRDYEAGKTEKEMRAYSGVQLPTIDPYPNTGSGQLVPTVIFVTSSGEKKYGQQAVNLGAKGGGKDADKPSGELHKEFKMNLASSDPQVRNEAEQSMDNFFEFLYERYRATKVKDFDVEIVEEHTYVSYPAKWPDITRRRTLKAAEKAGFPDVQGLDEPNAAMRLLVSTEVSQTINLKQKGIIRNGKPLNVLLLDMGAGTTDLVLFRYNPEETHHEVLATYPPADNKNTFGGREVDKLLTDWLIQTVENTSASTSDKEKVLERLPRLDAEIKNWKENINNTLKEQAEVEDFPGFLLGVGNIEPITRVTVEKMLKEYLPVFPKLVNELLANAVKAKVIDHSNDIDLVVLTGGHSKWYWVEEMLLGKWSPKIPGDSGSAAVIKLDRIQADPDRIIIYDKPQEIVARGLTSVGLDISTRAANNRWLNIKVDVSEWQAVEMVTFGEPLPILGKYVFHRFEAKYQPNYSIQIAFDHGYGSNLNTALWLEQKSVTLETKEFGEHVAVTVGKVLGVVFDILTDGQERFEVEDTAEVFIKVYVDDKEELKAYGLLKGGDDFKDFKYFPINRSLPSEQEKQELIAAYQRRKSH